MEFINIITDCCNDVIYDVIYEIYDLATRFKHALHGIH